MLAIIFLEPKAGLLDDQYESFDGPSLLDLIDQADLTAWPDGPTAVDIHDILSQL